MRAGCKFRTIPMPARKPLVLSWFASAFLAAAVNVIPLHAQNLLTNGDFETPPYAPEFTITGWTIGGTGFVHSIEEGSTSPTHSAAFNVGGNSDGNTLSQSFPTTVGTLYRVNFDTGIFGMTDGTE